MENPHVSRAVTRLLTQPVAGRGKDDAILKRERNGGDVMGKHAVVSPAEWTEARKRLLAKDNI